MTEPAPPFSPVLIAGFVLRPLPPALLQPLLDLSMTLLRRRHPDLFERLSGIETPTVMIDPLDLPLRFILHADAAHPTLRAIADTDETPEDVTATIRGPLLSLIDLLEGRIDGDALFFTRELRFDGDTEAVVALRNAVDGAEVDLVEDVLSLLGPASRPARHALSLGQRLARRFARDLDLLRAAVVAPADRRAEAQAADLKRLEQKVATLDKASRRSRRAVP
ncbi:SCP2 domain-containing protein [Magnetospira sp. QH-2]|uniref:ubiquinone anaerobic biosynthesis accessory factor UbiT n=1 Tax=Magnetospira sp. (strain QH-2) TaxID=1288970 RepID=UPI0003E81944|nr:SCP2 sterol-binding domain-containing protein [Magnetospira sp. QH-2]CCQ75247.1 putative lipid carrier protein [Magnetospira sp. QH-2]